MREYYHIGEISALFRITVETLRYYDHEGLLQPEKIADNGYRLYSSRQFERIGTVLALRSADVPAQEIRGLLESKTTDEAVKRLDRQLDALHARISELERARAKLGTIRDQLGAMDHAGLPAEMNLPELHLIAIPYRQIPEGDGCKDRDSGQNMHAAWSREEEGELDIEGTRGVQQALDPAWLPGASIFSSISVQDLELRRYHKYTHYGLLSETPVPMPHPLMRTVPSGKHLVASVLVRSHNHDEVDAVYDRMQAYAREKGLLLSGPAIEKTIFDLEPGGGPEHIHVFTLMIPVRPV